MLDQYYLVAAQEQKDNFKIALLKNTFSKILLS